MFIILMIFRKFIVILIYFINLFINFSLESKAELTYFYAFAQKV